MRVKAWFYSRLFGGSASGVFRGMAKLAAGSAAARLVGVATTPLITRLYAPADYGALSIFTSLITMIMPFVAFQYPSAIPLPKHNSVAVNLLSAIVALNVVTVAIITVGAVLFAPYIGDITEIPVTGSYIFLLVLGLVGAGLYEIGSMYATRLRDYNRIAKTLLVQSLAGRLVQLALGLLGFKVFGLLIGQIISQSAGAGSLWRAPLQDLQRYRHRISVRRMYHALKRYSTFPIYRLPAQLLLSVSTETPLLFVAAIYSTSSAGQFGLAVSMTALPMRLFGRAVTGAYYAEVAALGKKAGAEIYALTKQVTVRLALLSILPTLALLVFGEPLFALVFGESWRLAGTIAGLLSITLAPQLICGGITQGLAVIGKDGYFLLFNLERLASVLIYFAVTYFFELSILSSTLVYSLLLAVHRTIQITLTLRLMRRHAGIT